MVTLTAMRRLRFLPLTFVAGAEGFAIFAPYLFVFIATVHVVRRRQRARALASA